MKTFRKETCIAAFFCDTEQTDMNEPTDRYPVPASSMEKAAFLLGVFSIFLMMTGLSIIVGSIGVTLALLSRGSRAMGRKAKQGLLTSLVGIIGGFVVTIVAFFSLFSGDWNQTMDRLDRLYETYITQGSLDPSDLDEILPESQTPVVNSEKTAFVISFDEGGDLV